jgi:NAD(P)-dependent dehydrogenase (short-subunit alcohol dehydrogenase family)
MVDPHKSNKIAVPHRCYNFSAQLDEGQRATMYDLSNKVAIVTGAGGRRGIGRAIALRLAQEGADVVVTDIQRGPEAIRLEDRQAGWRGLPSVVGEVEALGRRSLGLYSDVSDSAQVADMVSQTLERFGRIDILVNNAGSQPGRDRVLVVELEEDAFDEVQRVNVKGTFLCSKAVARHMIGRGGGGKIIIISSGAGKRGIARYAAYCASKFALIGFTQSLAQELAPYRINVNAICPGLVDTERVDFIAAALAPQGESAEEYRAQMIRERNSRIPLGRVAVGDDIAKMAAFLSSRESDYLTGLSISVSGGAEMG